MSTVTSYLEKDKQDLIAGEEADEWKRKVELLGLDGQKELLGESKSPIPFKRITAADLRIIEAFCPDTEKVESYDKEAIPLEALALLALAKHENYFDTIKVYYATGKPDPFLVGFKGSEKYLIAQWGPEKLSWDELSERARRAWKERSKAALEAAIKQAETQLATLDHLANEHFRGGWVHLVS